MSKSEKNTCHLPHLGILEYSLKIFQILHVVNIHLAFLYDRKKSKGNSEIHEVLESFRSFHSDKNPRIAWCSLPKKVAMDEQTTPN